MNFKTEKVSYKVKQSKENPEEKQAVFENHHEPIIDRDTWERVQELRKQRKRPNRYDEVGLFSGILFFHPAHQRPAVPGTGPIRGEAGPGQGPVLCRVGRPAAGPELESEAENRH